MLFTCFAVAVTSVAAYHYYFFIVFFLMAVAMGCLAEVMRCVRAGLLESPVVPHDLTIRCAEMFDVINATWRAEE